MVTAQPLRFDPLVAEGVLDRQAILSITQDPDGRLWFGGQSNLFVYDSQNVVNLIGADSLYRNLGYITQISITARNDLFVGTASGLHVYNLDRHSVYPIFNSLLARANVYDIQHIRGSTFICTHEGLFLAERQGDVYHFYTLTAQIPVYTIEALGSLDYAVSTSQGVEIVQLSPAKTLMLREPLHIARLNPHHDYFTCIRAVDQQLWLGSRYSGLFRYDLRKGTYVHYHTANSDLASNNIRSIVVNAQGRLLIGTLKGLSVYTHKESFTTFRHNPGVGKSLRQNSIYDIFIDQQGITWVGTYYGGLHAVYPNTLDLRIYSSQRQGVRHLSSNIISCLAETDQGLWVGTEEEGINFIDRSIRRSTHYPALSRSNLIKDLFIQGDRLYIAQYSGGYSIVDLRTLSSQHFDLSQSDLDLRNNVYSIHADSRGNIYLGTNVGLYVRYADSSNHVRVEGLPAHLVQDIREDIHGNIFVHQYNQLYVKKIGETIFEPVTLPSGFTVSGMYTEGRSLWLTTNKGVGVISDTESLRYRHVLEVPHNGFGRLLKDGNDLWIASQSGLQYIDLESRYTNLLNIQDGLPVGNLKESRLYLSKDSLLYITTLNGLVSISPHSIQFNKQHPRVLLSQVSVNDRQLTSGRIYRRDGQQFYEISLDYGENALRIDFAGSNLIKPLKNKYKYKLKEFDVDWVETALPSIRYTKLPSGRHRLLIHASNNDGVWSDVPLVVHITVHPPFWKTWWAYTVYVLILAGIAYLIFRFSVERQLLLQSEVEHDKKIRFFTQISHEIRTPLTLITTPLDDIISTSVDDIPLHRKLRRVKNNADKLLSLVNELLDFKKFDDHKQQLHRSNTELKTYIEDFFYLLTDAAHHKGLNYYIERMDDVGYLAVDVAQFDKVLFNLLSNAIKFTPAGGTVCLELIDGHESIQLRVWDDGIGVSDVEQFRIFEEYYREGKAEGSIGTGIGLALTKEIVGQHGGQIRCDTVERADKAWTVFTAVLPKVVLDEPEPDLRVDEGDLALSTTAEDTLSVKGHSTRTLLLIEDNQELLRSLVELFQGEFEILQARDGEEGLRLAQTHIPDLILSDIMMPHMNGVELCQAIRSHISTSHIPVVLLTSLGQESMQLQGLEGGANLYITKPFRRKELFLSVRNLLQINQSSLKELLQIRRQQLNQLDHAFMDRLDTLLDTHLGDSALNVDFISRHMGMSAPVLYKKLKSLCNQSVNNYVKIYRLTRAKDLLLTDMSVSQVAYQVGFADPKYFSKEFKKQFICSPSEYKNRAVAGES